MFKLPDKTTFMTCNVKNREIFGVDCPVAPMDRIYFIRDNRVVSRSVENIVIAIDRIKINWFNMYGESERGYTYLDCLNDSWFVDEELALKALKDELNNKLNSLYSMHPEIFNEDRDE